MPWCATNFWNWPTFTFTIVIKVTEGRHKSKKMETPVLKYCFEFLCNLFLREIYGFVCVKMFCLYYDLVFKLNWSMWKSPTKMYMFLLGVTFLKKMNPGIPKPTILCKIKLNAFSFSWSSTIVHYCWLNGRILSVLDNALSGCERIVKSSNTRRKKSR